MLLRFDQVDNGNSQEACVDLLLVAVKVMLNVKSLKYDHVQHERLLSRRPIHHDARSRILDHWTWTWSHRICFYFTPSASNHIVDTLPNQNWKIFDWWKVEKLPLAPSFLLDLGCSYNSSCKYIHFVDLWIAKDILYAMDFRNALVACLLLTFVQSSKISIGMSGRYGNNFFVTNQMHKIILSYLYFCRMEVFSVASMGQHFPHSIFEIGQSLIRNMGLEWQLEWWHEGQISCL